MNLLEHIVARAKSDKQRIVLPEATEERTLRAADRVLADDIANLILIGNPDEIVSSPPSGTSTTSAKPPSSIPRTTPRARNTPLCSPNSARRKA